MFNSNQINQERVDRFKDAIRPTLKFPLTVADQFALAEALEELAAEIRLDASKKPS